MRAALFLLALPLVAQSRLDLTIDNSQVRICPQSWGPRSPALTPDCGSIIRVHYTGQRLKLASYSLRLSSPAFAEIEGPPTAITLKNAKMTYTARQQKPGIYTITAPNGFISVLLASHHFHPRDPSPPGSLDIALTDCAGMDMNGKTITVRCADGVSINKIK